ncbi:membrane fusion protein, multidrug efflux system [Variovorax sp. OK605]|uniref:efflux RND transporter periplasmic adaptor subunit n=1 Tax=Variovorax sp. OK605 TaxID=1855317 RepID=UPI0008DEE6C0|nr:efflux RND transporter periplasmic adaptor subunit [Variovorax sp. OK605]SFQ08331.1 membrane fusion protein, multidrug efflux system [Variovorax sp. OK605]
MKIDWVQKKWGVKSLAALASLALVGCENSAPEAAAPPAQVSVIALSQTRVDAVDELPGRVAAVRTAEIRAQVSGIVQRRLFEQGAEIRAGQPLFQINPAPFRADVESAAAALKRAEAARNRAQVQADRLHPLLDAEAVSRQVYDDAVTQRDQALADVAQAKATLSRKRLDLQFSTVDAPIAGRIDQALVTEGALVGASDTNPMARVQQIDQVYVDVRQPASTLDAMRDVLSKRSADNQGLPAAILRSDGVAYPVKGRILFSGVNVDAGTGDVLVRVLVDNAKRDLLPGMFVRARVPRGSYPDALMVPQQAVVRNGNEVKVWVLDQGNKAHLTSIQLGELIGRQYRVRDGLRAGQKIVTEGMERLTDGALATPSALPKAAPALGDEAR